MLVLLNNNNNNNKKKMGDPFFSELKKQASFFLKEKIKTARLALTDVTPAQLMTEEITDGNQWPPDTRMIAVVSQTAFEVDDYWRIVEILHKRFWDFDREHWRGAYKALILLQRLLTHGPLRIAEEFDGDKDIIKEIGNFQYIDEKGFNWGLSVKTIAERVMQLLESTKFLKEERDRARNLTRGIKGFGSFSKRSTSVDASSDHFPSKLYGRCNSQFDRYKSEEENELFSSCRNSSVQNGIRKSKQDIDLETIQDHPFCDSEHQTQASLLSPVE